VHSVLFSPDAQHVVTASADNTARVWNVETGRQSVILRGHTGSIWSAAFSRDGRQVVTSSADNTARLWNVETGKQVGVFEGHSAVVWSAVFSPDGATVITAGADGTARIWRVFSGLQSLVDHSKEVAPRCLTQEQREEAFLEKDAPAWCIERGKWPYHTADWKGWLRNKRTSANTSVPDTP